MPLSHLMHTPTPLRAHAIPSSCRSSATPPSLRHTDATYSAPPLSSGACHCARGETSIRRAWRRSPPHRAWATTPWCLPSPTLWWSRPASPHTVLHYQASHALHRARHATGPPHLCPPGVQQGDHLSSCWDVAPAFSDMWVSLSGVKRFRLLEQSYSINQAKIGAAPFFILNIEQRHSIIKI
jgi:hypothetical protein